MGSTYFTWAVLGYLYSEDKTDEARNALKFYMDPEAPYCWSYPLIFVFLLIVIGSFIIGIAAALSETNRKADRVTAWACLFLFITSLFAMGYCFDQYEEYLKMYRGVR